MLLVKYPVKPGDTWEVNHQAGADKVTGTAKVGNFEEVQVPAGRVTAIVPESLAKKSKDPFKPETK